MHKSVQKNNDTIQNKKQKDYNHVLYNIHSSAIKSHNTVYARTALLKAAELVSSFSSDGRRFPSINNVYIKLIARFIAAFGSPVSLVIPRFTHTVFIVKLTEQS